MRWPRRHSDARTEAAPTAAAAPPQPSPAPAAAPLPAATASEGSPARRPPGRAWRSAATLRPTLSTAPPLVGARAFALPDVSGTRSLLHLRPTAAAPQMEPPAGHVLGLATAVPSAPEQPVGPSPTTGPTAHADAGTAPAAFSGTEPAPLTLAPAPRPTAPARPAPPPLTQATDAYVGPAQEPAEPYRAPGWLRAAATAPWAVPTLDSTLAEPAEADPGPAGFPAGFDFALPFTSWHAPEPPKPSTAPGPPAVRPLPPAPRPAERRRNLGQSRRLGMGASPGSEPLPPTEPPTPVLRPVDLPLPPEPGGPEGEAADDSDGDDFPRSQSPPPPPAALTVRPTVPSAPSTPAPLVHPQPPQAQQPAAAVPVEPTPEPAPPSPEPAAILPAPSTPAAAIRAAVEAVYVSAPGPGKRPPLPLVLPPAPADPPGVERVPPGVAATFQAAYGADVSRVPVFRDSQASTEARRLKTRAFARGGAVYLPAEEGPLDAPAARRLLGHELMHVVQQRTLGGALAPEHTPQGRRLEAQARQAESLFGAAAPAPGPLTHAPQAKTLDADRYAAQIAQALVEMGLAHRDGSGNVVYGAPALDTVDSSASLAQRKKGDSDDGGDAAAEQVKKWTKIKLRALSESRNQVPYFTDLNQLNEEDRHAVEYEMELWKKAARNSLLDPTWLLDSKLNALGRAQRRNLDINLLDETLGLGTRRLFDTEVDRELQLLRELAYQESGSDSEFTVPRIIGMTRAKAERTLARLAAKMGERIDYKYQRSLVRKDRVIYVEPGEGEWINPEADELLVVISLGPEGNYASALADELKVTALSHLQFGRNVSKKKRQDWRDAAYASTPSDEEEPEETAAENEPLDEEGEGAPGKGTAAPTHKTASETGAAPPVQPDKPVTAPSTGQTAQPGAKGPAIASASALAGFNLGSGSPAPAADRTTARSASARPAPVSLGSGTVDAKPDQRYIAMPKLIGRNIEQAMRILTKETAGLMAEPPTIRTRITNHRPGTVLETYPRAGKDLGYIETIGTGPSASKTFHLDGAGEIILVVSKQPESLADARDMLLGDLGLGAISSMVRNLPSNVVPRTDDLPEGASLSYRLRDTFKLFGTEEAAEAEAVGFEAEAESHDTASPIPAMVTPPSVRATPPGSTSLPPAPPVTVGELVSRAERGDLDELADRLYSRISSRLMRDLSNETERVGGKGFGG